MPLNVRARVALEAKRPTMDRVDDIYRFWEQQKPHGNYFRPLKSSPRSETILVMLRPRITATDSILEVGCNVGRNLNHLYQAGYRRLGGVELSRRAVERLRTSYPDLAAVPVDVGPAERVLPRHETCFYDVVFTMAVLEHVHPASKSVFAEMARVARKYVLTIEPRQGHASHRQYPWDIVKEFEAVGLRVVEKRVWSSLWQVDRTRENHWNPDFDNYDAVLFSHVADNQRPHAVQSKRIEDAN